MIPYAKLLLLEAEIFTGFMIQFHSNLNVDQCTLSSVFGITGYFFIV